MAVNQLSLINHIVVLMLENRSFDEMLGLLYADAGNVSPVGQAFEGLTGTESNPGTDGKPVQVYSILPGPNAYYMPGADPGEGYAATNSQLFGSTTPPIPPVATNNGFVTDFSYTLGWEAKDNSYTIVSGTTANDIMGVFPPSMLPVLSGLGRGFAVCDFWFGSAPTETLPNRAFAHAATSQGHLSDTVKSYTCPTIYSQMTAKGVNWGIYGYNAPPLTRQTFTDLTNAADSNFGEFVDFQQAAANGSLPSYVFLEPSWGSSGNSQHPNYDVALGEQLIHDVYYALRNGPAWNETLLVVVYDEHGGCYDHVPPPTNATPPDNSVGDDGFDFRRFGPRVPAVLVSPLIAAGTVFRVPVGATPLDHTSILKTVETRWAIGSLTARDAAAIDFGAVLTLSTPRADDPLAGVSVPVSTGTNPSAGKPSHLQEVHAELVSQLPVPDGEGGVHHRMPKLRTSEDYDAYIRSRTEAWKASRAKRIQRLA
jgi:phospholipase C